MKHFDSALLALLLSSFALHGCLRVEREAPAEATADATPGAAPGAGKQDRQRSGNREPIQRDSTTHTSKALEVPAGALAPTEDERNTIAVFEAAAASVVYVTQKRNVVVNWSGATREVEAGTGSGFIWDEQGHIVTNFHVVQGAEALEVTLQNQKDYVARIVGVEPRKDIAVLQLEGLNGDKLVPIAQPAPDAGHSHPPLRVGQKTIAIGNPFGLDHTLTVGVVSAIGREIDGIGGVTIRDMIQTDAAINPGNSGGPLLNSSAQLIGMNTMIFSKSGASAGIGFAVPVETIQRITKQLIRSGKVEQVGIGIQIDPAGRLEQRQGLKGVIVLDTGEGTPARKSGLNGVVRTRQGWRLQDILVGITFADGKKVAIENYDDLYNALDGHSPGESVTLDVQRDGKTRQVPLSLIRVD